MTAAAASRAEHVRGVVFDLDGTLVDGYLGIATAVNAARSRFGLAPLLVDDVKGRVGLGLSHLMEDVVGRKHAAEGAAVFREVYDAVCVEQTYPAPGLVTTLEALRERGVRTSVASNKPVGYSLRILERLGVLASFDTVQGPETAGAIKPDPAMIRSCLVSMSVTAHEAIYVGDMALDAEAGLRAGVRVVLVAGGSTPLADLKGTGLPVLESLSDLVPWLSGGVSEAGPRV